MWLAYANVEPPEWYIPSGDSFSYWHYGNEIAEGRGYVSYLDGEATAYYPIGFPAILGRSTGSGTACRSSTST